MITAISFNGIWILLALSGVALVVRYLTRSPDIQPIVDRVVQIILLTAGVIGVIAWIGQGLTHGASAEITPQTRQAPELTIWSALVYAYIFAYVVQIADKYTSLPLSRFGAMRIGSSIFGVITYLWVTRNFSMEEKQVADQMVVIVVIATGIITARDAFKVFFWALFSGLIEAFTKRLPFLFKPLPASFIIAGDTSMKIKPHEYLAIPIAIWAYEVSNHSIALPEIFLLWWIVSRTAYAIYALVEDGLDEAVFQQVKAAKERAVDEAAARMRATEH